MASERKFVAENIRRVLLKEYFMKETEMAGFGGIDIQRTPMGTRVTLIVERPGMVIGRKGGKIKDLTRVVSEKYGFDNPQIEVQECRDSASNPQIMAQKLALALERGWHFRRAGHSTLRRIIDADVKGCQVKLCGKLTGQRHRTEKFKWGHIKFCGEPALTTMDRGYAIAKKKLGLIGVSVDIMRKDAHLPDEIIIKELPDLGDIADIKGGEVPVEAPQEEAQRTEDEETVDEVPEVDKEEARKTKSKRKQKKEERRKASEDEEEPLEDSEEKDGEPSEKDEAPGEQKAEPAKEKAPAGDVREETSEAPAGTESASKEASSADDSAEKDGE
ncbi:MAG: 30S ribosomal protein S3 [Thermoplasmatota archaeon]